MPRIPLYQQGNIASSAVGTPGVDTSGAKTWAAAASGANMLADVAYKEIQANNAELKRKQREQEALAKARQEALDTIEADTHLKQFEVGLDSQLDTIKKDNAQAPTVWTSTADAYGTKAMAEMAQAIPSESVRLKFQKDGINVLRSKLSGLQGAASTQEAANAKGHFETTLDLQVVQAGNVKTQEGFDVVFDGIRSPENVKKAEFVFGAEAEKKLRATEDAAADQHLARLLDEKRFAEAQAFLDNPKYQGILDAKERANSRKALQEIKDATERRELVRLQKEQLAHRNVAAIDAAQAEASGVPYMNRLALADKALQEAAARGDSQGVKDAQQEKDRIQSQARQDAADAKAAVNEGRGKSQMDPTAAREVRVNIDAMYRDYLARLSDKKKGNNPSLVDVNNLVARIREAADRGAYADHPGFLETQLAKLRTYQMKGLDALQGQGLIRNVPGVDAMVARDQRILKWASESGADSTAYQDKFESAEISLRLRKGYKSDQALSADEEEVLRRTVNAYFKRGGR